MDTPTPEEIRTLLTALLLCGSTFTDEEWQESCSQSTKTLKTVGGGACFYFYPHTFKVGLTGFDDHGYCCVTEAGRRYVLEQ